jgi:two-component system phosphate regulon sensor histidine kinase PhoR
MSNDFQEHKTTPKKVKRNYKFASKTSFAICFLAIFIIGPYIYFIANQPLWHILFLFVIFFVICFVAIQLRAQKFIYKRIQHIYNEVAVLDATAFDKMPIATDMKMLKSQVEQYAREKKVEIETLQVREEYRKEFLGNVSHELKTPLFTIQGYIDTLIDGAHKDKVIRKKYLARAQKGVERLTYIVNDLDMITKLEIGDMSLDKDVFDIVELVNQVFDQFEMKATKKNIALETDIIYKNQILVHADAARVQQVISNLVVNSIKYGRDNGTTEVSIEDLINNKVIVRVTDNGEGIAAEHIPRLFERFFRVDRSGNRKEGGSGLGLSIVKHIIETHNERIYIESEPGIGSEFSFTLEKASSSKRPMDDIEVIVDE